MQSRRLLVHSLQHEGLTRTALLYVPRHMRDQGPLPLVLMFHGGASSPEAISRSSAMHRVAEREGFVVAYPAGSPGAAGLTWNPGSGEPGTDDARYVRKLIFDLQGRCDIDPARIFAAGFSVGGSLVYELACLLADRLAAVAVVSGSMTTSYCQPAQPVPLIHIHGTSDRRVPLKGGRGSGTRRKEAWPPVQAGIDRWREINGCADEPRVVRMGLAGVTGYRYSGKADVELWLVEAGRHSWPGSRRDAAHPDAFSASEKIWSFFAAHPRPRFVPALAARDRMRRAGRGLQAGNR